MDIADGERESTGSSSPSFREAVRAWVRIALQSFGGPAGQIAVMHRIVVLEKRWLSEERFLHALNYCMLLPGPEAQQLATYIGWLLHGARGGLVAGTLFVLPGFVAIGALSLAYVTFHGAGLLLGIFFGLKAAVLAVVVEALARVARRALRSRWQAAVAVVGFVALFFFAVPFPLIVAAAGLAGWLVAGRLDDRSEAPPTAERTAPVSLSRTLAVLATGLALWWGPVAALAAWLGRESVFVRLGLFFSQTAVVTWGGAYAVLAYVGQRAVETFGWLSPGEMIDGLALAETTPGPLIQVVQFVGFMAAYRAPAPWSPLWAGLVASVLVTWVTYVPCFLWIFLGAPYVERLRANQAIRAALAGISAAVVGAIGNLVLWFALHTLFAGLSEHRVGPLRLLVPDLATIDPAAFAIALAAALALLRFRLGLGWVLLGAALAGVGWRAFTG